MAKGKLEVEVMVSVITQIDVELDEAGFLSVRLLHRNGAVTERRVEKFNVGDRVTLTFDKP